MGTEAREPAIGATPPGPIGLFRGASYPFRGIDFVFRKHPGLVRIWIWPVLATLLLLVLFLWLVWQWHSVVLNAVWDTPSGEGVWDTVLWGLHGALDLVLLLVGVALAFFVTALVSPLVAAPFNGRLSEAIEHLKVGGESSPFNLRQEALYVLRSVGLELLKLLIYLAFIMPLWVLSFVAPWLSPVTSLVGFLVTALHAAVDYTDSPQERRQRGVLQTYRFALDHLKPMLGFGTGAVVFLFVPFLNLLFLPAVVAGGTLLYLDLEVAGGVEAVTRPGTKNAG